MIPDLNYIELAHRLNTEHHARLMKMQAHFRGNRKSFSLISLRKESPELGQRRIKKEDKALEWLEQWEQIPPEPPKRPTREKELQAWSILNALHNGGKLPFDRDLSFLTSELVIYKGTTKCINDILALDKQNNLVVVELKSTRAKKQIEAQVEAFMQIIKQNRPFFRDLVKLILKKDWSEEVRGMVVWNGTSRTERKIRKEYREVCYMETTTNGRRCIDYDKENIQFKELQWVNS